MMNEEDEKGGLKRGSTKHSNVEKFTSKNL